MYCLDLNGNPVWKFPAKNMIAAWPPAYYKETIYFGSWDRNLYAVGVDGRLKWKVQFKEAVMCPFLWDEKLYFSCWDNNIYCADANTGKILWKFEIRIPLVSDRWFQTRQSLTVTSHYAELLSNN